MELINANKNVRLNKILSTPGLVFGGIDYSLGKMIGQDFNNPEQIVNHMFGAWNELFYTEPNKYDVFKAFNCKGVIDGSIVHKLNQSVEPETLKSNLTPKISRQTIQHHVRKYEFKDEHGFALVFIQEYYCKPYQNASYWVVVINKSNKEIAWAKPIKVQCKGGFGFKNYWATTILNLLLIIKTRQKTWKKR